MFTQLELLDRARVVVGKREGKPRPVTYYRIGQLLGFTSAHTSRLTNGQSLLSEEACVKLAELCDLSPAFVLACIGHERAEREHNADLSGTWRAIADAFGKHAAAVFAVLVLVGMAAAPKAYAGAGAADHADGLYIMRSGRRRRRPKNRPLALPPPASISAALRGWNRPNAA